MSAFPPREAAMDFYAAAYKYTPGTHSGALWNLQFALPAMGEACWMIANGWRQMIHHIQGDLQGGLKPEVIQVMSDIYRLQAKAAQLASDLPATFAKIHAEDIRRAQTRGAHTANVPVGR